MNCSVEWTKKDLVEYTSISFVLNAYRDHRKNILFEYEKSRIPDTMEEAINLKQRADCQKIITDCENKIIITQAQFEEPACSDEDIQFNLGLFDEINRLTKIKYVERVKLSELSRFYRRKHIKTSTNKRFFNCPSENCRGFICSTKSRCEICDCTVCKICMDIKKDDEHVCDPNTVETISLLKSDSKNCPGCMTQIFRISGCPQMFCTVCHIAFDWNSGKIVERAGTIHNPHYFEYLRRQNIIEAPADIVCGGRPTYTQFFHKSTELRFDNNFMNLFQLLPHLENVYLPRLATNEPDNKDLRIKYILSQINEDDFRRELHKREKKFEKDNELRDILRTFILVCNDLLRKAYNEEKPCMVEFKNSLNEMRLYTNTALVENVEKIFNCVVPIIPESWSSATF
jgi:hypothetical protein